MQRSRLMPRFGPAALPCRMSAAAALAASWLLAAPASPALAQDAAGGPAQAEALIREAMELRKAGKDALAYPLLQKAYEVHTAPRTAIQLGLVEMQLGYWLEAERHLNEGLASPRDPWVFNNRDSIEASLARVKAAIGEILVTGTPAGAEVLVNGRPAGKLPLPAAIRAAEGPAKVELRAPGHQASSRTLSVLGGRRAELQVALVPATEAPPPPQPPAIVEKPLPAPAPAGGGAPVLKWAGVTLAAAGVVGVAAGVTYLVGRSDGCGSLPAGAQCNQRAPSATPGWVMLGGGIAAGLAGGLLWYHGRDTHVGIALQPAPMLVLGGGL